VEATDVRVVEAADVRVVEAADFKVVEAAFRRLCGRYRSVSPG